MGLQPVFGRTYWHVKFKWGVNHGILKRDAVSLRKTVLPPSAEFVDTR
jgi:hypothetical protein